MAQPDVEDVVVAGRRARAGGGRRVRRKRPVEAGVAVTVAVGGAVVTHGVLVLNGVAVGDGRPRVALEAGRGPGRQPAPVQVRAGIARVGVGRLVVDFDHHALTVVGVDRDGEFVARIVVGRRVGRLVDEGTRGAGQGGLPCRGQGEHEEDRQGGQPSQVDDGSLEREHPCPLWPPRRAGQRCALTGRSPRPPVYDALLNPFRYPL